MVLHLLSSVYQILPPKRFTVYRPVICLSFTSPQCETFLYHPRVSIKISEADGSSSTIAAAISSTYWLLPPSLDRLGRFAQPFQRLLLSIAVFLSHILLTHRWTTHSASVLGLIAHMVGLAVPKMEADQVVEAHCHYSGQFVLFFSCKTLTLFRLGDVSTEMHHFHFTMHLPNFLTGVIWLPTVNLGALLSVTLASWVILSVSARAE